MSSNLVCKDDLIAHGFKEHTSKTIIRQAKEIMVQKGYPFYNNRRLGRVPINVVESIIGVSLRNKLQGEME